MTTLRYSFGNAQTPTQTYTGEATVDVSGNGVLDGIPLDFDGDGNSDDVAWDSDGDGVVDTILVSSQGDGAYDTAYYDPSGNGHWNVAEWILGEVPHGPGAGAVDNGAGTDTSTADIHSGSANIDNSPEDDVEVNEQNAVVAGAGAAAAWDPGSDYPDNDDSVGAETVSTGWNGDLGITDWNPAG